ncbi:MAG: 2-dehydropantoate 2-reductase [Candidatus Caenarcaniphilales bacterium]|nr:2-dehydropantoate 2-reductase [Candidatus Caenarcaniphilales bacterium]
MYRIWVYGAGAVGGFYGAKLALAGNEVLFVARGEHLHSLQTQGLKIESIEGDISLNHVQCCSEDELEEHFPPDFVIVATKRLSNKHVADRLKVVLAPHVPVLIFQNGLHSERIFEERLIADRVCRVIIQLSSAIISPGVIRHSANGDVLVPLGGAGADQLIEAFGSSGVRIETSENFPQKIWSKLVWNASFNSVSALSRQTTKFILDNPDGNELIRALMKEVILIAEKSGVELSPKLIDTQIKLTYEDLVDISTSTLEDVKAGKPIEYQAIVGDLIEEAERLEIKVPHLKTVYTLLKLLDQSQLTLNDS